MLNILNTFIISIILFCVVNTLVVSTPIPIKIKKLGELEKKISITEKSLIALDAPKNIRDELTIAINNASELTGISPLLITALMYTESTFKIDAVSSKNYKGLMQTPWASCEWIDVDVLIGARILKEKIKYANGDITLALALYKGGNNPLAKKHAMETIKVYNQLQNI